MSYATRGVNYTKIGFMKLTSVTNFINLFGVIYVAYWHIALNFDLCCAARDIIIPKKV